MVATRTTLLAKDPMLWFTMMLMPVAPTALKFMALADVSRTEANEKMVIARFLAVGIHSAWIIANEVVANGFHLHRAYMG